MNVIKITPRGYCHGVIRAIEIVKKAINSDCPRPIYILGSIIHNKYVVDEFTKLGVITLEGDMTRFDLLDNISSGTVITTAHGVSPRVIEKAHAKNLNIIDATCLDVLKVHNKVKKYLNEGFEIIYIGKKKHPESEGIEEIDKRIHLIENEDEVNFLNLNDKIFVSNQTTMSIYDIKAIYESIKKKYPNAIIDDDICNATYVRQKALNEVKADLIIVVGDLKSSNTKKLFEIASLKNKAIQIESVMDIDPSTLINVKTVAVTSGASTPSAITNSVIEYLNNFDSKNKDSFLNRNEPNTIL